VGDIVLVAEQPASGGARKREVREREAGGVKGVVTRVGRAGLGVAVDGEEGGKEKGEGEGVLGGGEKRVWIVKVADDVTFKR
jgi:DNA polymerase alpha-associated DNA helicase A